MVPLPYPTYDRDRPFAAHGKEPTGFCSWSIETVTAYAGAAHGWRGYWAMAADEDRLNQEWSELLEELRVVLPGTEVLFAFLLTVPFSERFRQITRADRTVYFIAFLAAAAATLLLIAPSAQHRLLWRHGLKDAQLRIATGFAIAGTVCFAVAVASVVYLVTHVLYDDSRPALATGGAIAFVLLGWYAVPFALRLRRGRQP